MESLPLGFELEVLQELEKRASCLVFQGVALRPSACMFKVCFAWAYGEVYFIVLECIKMPVVVHAE